MAKTVIIVGALLAAVVLLVIVAQEPKQTTVTTPIQQSPGDIIVNEVPSPRADTSSPPSPRSSEPTPSGIDAAKVFPSEVNFWVNEIYVPASSYGEGSFIPLDEDDLKTFAGSFGRYQENPTAHLTVKLCSEYAKIKAAPVCESVPLLYRDNMVTFARGYQFDEFIGGQAAKDYIAYYTIYAGDTVIANSNRANIRTV